MDKDILRKIEQLTPEFSKGQKKIAAYIRNNYDRAAFMTAGRLGQTVGVSESTVVRFASDLGFDGYPSMRKALQEMIRSRLTSVQRIEVAREFMNQDNVLQTVFSSDLDNVHMTMSSVSRPSFNAAVDLLLNARRVYILGMRASTGLASFLSYYLNQILDDVYNVREGGSSEVYEQMMHITNQDVIVGISYPRYSTRTVKAMKFARESGAKVIGITDGDLSPLAGLSDVTLYARSDMVSFLDSLVAPMSLINALVVAVGIKSEKDLTDIFDKLETVWKDYEVYE